MVGPGPVAWAEDIVYGAEDFVHVHTQGSAPPKTFWEPTKDVEEPIVVHAKDGKTIVLDPLLGAPAAVPPPFDAVAAPGDGVWSALHAPSDVAPVAMWRTLIHPDPKRPFAAVAVAAMDLTQVRLVLVAGTDEPKSQQVYRADRPGKVADEDLAELLAVFNGGFRAMHGNYGMRVGPLLFIPPRDIGCTVASSPTGELSIRTFSAIKAEEPSFAWYRQTPPCLVEAGEPNPGLLSEFNKNWGATVGGDTIIRRSAIGLSKDKHYLFYALGDATTAQSIGKAMQFVGAEDAAQLDVNFSYPRFFTAEHGSSGTTLAEPLIPELKFSPSEYVSLPSQRDFFYVARKKQVGRRAESSTTTPHTM